MRDPRVRLLPHPGSMCFVALGFLVLSSHTILFFGAACPLACSLLLGMNTPVLGTVGGLPPDPFLQSVNGR